ncbi:MAG: hypothetical protein OK455_10600 [Thaumarchaeota archaeon]|nr:hypothetical protein [Nitrososphaerota archaeon]
MARELLLGETILNMGGTTNVPEKVMEALSLKPKPGDRSKLLWTPAGDEVIVTRGTPQSDWRKTMLRKNGTSAIPRHVQQALNLKITPQKEERVLWIRKGDLIIMRKGTREVLNDGTVRIP